MQLQRACDAKTAYQYGCDLRRLYPWPDVAAPTWGAAIASVRPNEGTTPHSHDESETFIVLEGEGEMHVGEESARLTVGDVVLIPKDATHRFHNVSGEKPLVFLTIFWDSPEARARMRTLAAGDHPDR